MRSFRTSGGSSPLTRGKHQGGGLGCRRLGLIPAHAGKTERDPYSDETLSGSSPLTRGKPPRSPSRVRVMGLIPAHAGKTRTRPSTRRTPTAHPRSRGENQAITQPLVFVGGSSPLTRGKPVATAPSRLPIRLIPAHAGKTSHASSHAGWGWAHPRSRGENNQFSLPSPVSDGSSPLTRGKPIAALVAIFVARLIPAHAGKTTSSA